MKNIWLQFVSAGIAVWGLFPALYAVDCGAADDGPKRTNNRSPLFAVAPDDVAFHMNYTGFDTNAPGGGARFLVNELGPKVLDMIDQAERYIIFSVFLFDNFHADGEPEDGIVETITARVIARKHAQPDMTVAFIFDPSHKAYGKRIADAEKHLLEAGVDVFYSDLLAGLKKASWLGVREGLGHASRLVDRLTFNVWGNFWSAAAGNIPIPVGGEFDGETFSVEMAYNAMMLKANHRKLLVVDRPDGRFEAMFSSANPHNASSAHVNNGVSVVGRPARYTLNMMRKDAQHSKGLGRRFTRWHGDASRAYRKQYFERYWPELPMTGKPDGSEADRSVGVRIVTEQRIEEELLTLLAGVEANDEIRIQMFYLSYLPVLEALLEAGTRSGRPVQLLLDANKDSFNREKDGTPNRQVAAWLMQQAEERGLEVQVRWYATHGEQNHAKTLSITNEETGKYQLFTGSCNWTGRNLAGVNMESNIVLYHARAIVHAFNDLFALFWHNRDGHLYSVGYDAFQVKGSTLKWRIGEAPFYYSTF